MSASENGWQPAWVDQNALQWVTVPGTNVSLQILKGQPAAIMAAFAADFHAYVQPLRDGDSACYTPTNSVSTSNHLNGTAMDLDWNDHAFHVRGTFNQGQMDTIRALLDWYEDTIFWGGDWNDPIDEMHWQMGYGSYGNPKTQSFIDRKIRSDGFSTFRRGPTQAQPKMVTVPLTDNGDGTWTSPSPAWAHLIMRESGGNPTIIQGIIDVNSGGNEAQGLFQITPATWRAHQGTDFAASPRQATPQQQALVAARIFTANPSGSDWGAGLPGREDATELAAGLVPTGTTPTPIDDEGDFMSALSADEQRALYNEIMGPRPSRSPLRHVGEGNIGDVEDLVLNSDGSIHVLVVYLTAVILGDPDARALLREVASVNTSRYPDRVHDARLAQSMLNLIDQNLTAESAPATGDAPGMIPTPAPVIPPTPALPNPVPTPAPVQPLALPAAAGSLFHEITALTNQLSGVSTTIKTITEG